METTWARLPTGPRVQFGQFNPPFEEVFEVLRRRADAAANRLAPGFEEMGMGLGFVRPQVLVRDRGAWPHDDCATGDLDRARPAAFETEFLTDLLRNVEAPVGPEHRFGRL